MASKKKTTKKKTNPLAYAKVTSVSKAPTYKNTVKAPAAYKSTAVAPAAYTPGTYQSQYTDQLNAGLEKITNWNYDPLQDANYQALAKVYGARGNIAAKNSLADAAALNGGYGTSYAVSAAQQARNQYNQELAALIPELEQNAFNKAQVAYNAYKDADDTAYGRFRDTESDRQWKYTQDYQKYRDTEADNQWKYTQNYQAYRDKVGDNQWKYEQDYKKYEDALSQYQWAKNFNLDVYSLKKSSAGSGSSGGSGRKSSGGGGGYSTGSSSGSSGSNGVSAGGVTASGYGQDALSHAIADGKVTIGHGGTTKTSKTGTLTQISNLIKSTAKKGATTKKK